MAIGWGLLLTAAANIYSGTTSLTESNKAAENTEQQGLLVLTEALRDASIIREEGRNFMATQSLQFIGAGVELVGSALITMKQTLKYAEAEAKATEAKGLARAELAYTEADVTRAKGRAGLVGGILGAASSFIKK